MTTARKPFIICTMSIVIGLLCLSPSSAQIKPESIAGIWLLDEGSGTLAKDSSGHGYDADLKGNPTWVKGKLGQALEFAGDSYLEIRNSSRDLAFGGTAAFSISAWVRNQGGGTILGKFNGGVIGAYILQISGSTLSFHREVAPWAYGGTKALPSNDWAHVAATYDGAVMKLYVNGQFDAQQDRGAQSNDTATPVCIGARLTSGAPSQFSRGALDEVALFSAALTEDQIKGVMKGLTTTAARDPRPADGATDVARDTSLGWTGIATAATHNVYFGINREDVNAASTEAPRGVLVSKGQTEATYTPAGILTYGQTYFWRVDEVNGPPDFTAFRGRIWSFTAEPYAYPITSVTATASSSEKPTTGPANTINGSGLTGDRHGADAATMWNTAMTDPGPVWIQYQFDNVYKLSELWVWNYNWDFEPVIGYGFKDVAIEYSLDGTTWTLLKETQFAQATALAGYAHNTTVDLGGVLARYVKLTAKSNWSPVGIKQYGLSEVRFFHVPAQARAPQPTADAKNVSIDSGLDWRSGRDVTSEKVYFGTDKTAVSNGTVAARTVSSHGFDPGGMDFGTTYYWKVDEVGTTTYPGALWSFTTQEYALVEDFEDYTDQAGQEIFTAWIDGLTNSSGSLVGYLTAANGTFGETTIRHGGTQSMPFEYNNVKAPYYSEAQRTFDAPQDWTVNGADTLSLWIKGNAAQFVETAPGQYKVSSNSGDVLGHLRQLPLRLQAAHRGRLDFRPGCRSHRHYHELGEGGSHDPPESGSELRLCLHVPDAGRSQGLPESARDGRQRGLGPQQPQYDHLPALGQGRAQGQPVHRLLFHGWQNVDRPAGHGEHRGRPVTQPANDQHGRHRLPRPGGGQQQCGSRGLHRPVLRRGHDRHGHGSVGGSRHRTESRQRSRGVVRGGRG